VRLTVLVVDRTVPLALTQGNQLIARHLFPRLARRHRLVLVAAAHGSVDAGDVRDAYGQTFDAVHLVPRGRPMATLGGWVEGSLARLLPPVVAPLREARALRDMVARVRLEERVDLVHVRGLPMTAFVDAGRPRLVELVDAETLGSARTAAAVASGGHAIAAARAAMRARVARAVETRAVGRGDLVTTVAEADAVSIRALVPGLPVARVPNGVDTVYFAPMDMPEEPATLVFVGAFSFPPNIEAARVLVHEVLPEVRRSVPEVRLRLVGRDPAPAVRAMRSIPGVEVTGLVDDVRPFLARATLVVCPLVSGSGIKNKVLEALAMARPVLATPLAVEGIDVVPGRDAAVVERAALGAEVVRLLGSPGARYELALAGRRLVEQRYDWDTVADTYSSLYEGLVSGSASPARGLMRAAVRGSESAGSRGRSRPPEAGAG
jgi:glycosyltransferase involved in cell wall biosynthesis